MSIMNAFWNRSGRNEAPQVDEAPASAPLAAGENVVSTSDESSAEAPPSTPVDADLLRSNVIAALRTIYDPEIPVNIYDLGLVYGLDVDAGKVDMRMTLTTPACPVAASFPQTVEQRLYELPGVDEVRVELVWDPPWTMDRLSEETKLQLGLL
jgi:FeS assembly SUF system protein